MPAPSTDRNLLFGVLALQLDFVSRDALVAAMNAWVLDKGKPLGDILVEQGRLTAARLRLLDGLVDEHLRAHGDDAQHSLAALPAAGAVRQDLADVADQDLQASLGPPPSTDPDSTVDQSPSFVGGTAGALRYRVLRPHAQGGLGEVFVALDRELNREVALKQIRPEHADDQPSRARFLLEAELTGALEHPGVVPVYGLGCYADGRPFYAMRFIRGESLKDGIRRFHAADVPGRDPGERTLALRGLLTRFIAVCNAVAFAHSRGVLHRDLKPANVMLGKYGETLVVDWGLGKVVGRAEGTQELGEVTVRPSSGTDGVATQLGAVIGTPAFMSPEQAEGRLDELGPASDVYSLGTILYCILTGNAPFEGTDKGELLQRVARGDWRAPLQVKKGVSAPLDAVCRKAMALRPGDRYATALDLAGEVEHWLADEPVRAWKEPLRVRAGRWARRHRTWVASAAVLLVASVVGLGLGLWAVQVEKARTAEERDLAEANLRLAKKAVDDCLLLAAEEPLLLRQLGMQPLRRLLLEKALPFYENFRIQWKGDPSVQATLAENYTQLGTILYSLGRRKEGRGAFEQAQAIGEDLTVAHPEEPRYGTILGRLHFCVGNEAKQDKQLEPALQSYAKAVSILKAVLVRDEHQERARSLLRDTHYYRSRIFSSRDQHAEAVQEWDHAIELATGLWRPAFRAGRAISLAQLGDYRRAVDEANALAEEELIPSEHLYGLACVYSLSSAAAKEDAKLSYQYAARALQLLREAVKKGFKDVAHMKKDPKLDPLRSRDDFQKLLAQLEAGDAKKGP
jgi:serine/threonine-protein kinase